MCRAFVRFKHVRQIDIFKNLVQAASQTHRSSSHTVHVLIAVRYLLQQSTIKENSAPHQHLEEINPI